MSLKVSNEEFIEKCKNVHKDKPYDFSETKYINAKTYVEVRCLEKDENGLEHGVFRIRPDHLRTGHGCPKCCGRDKDISIMINKARVVHGDKYDYSKVVESNKRKWVIICPIHGEFIQDKFAHLNGNGCPKCNKGVVKSREEFIIDAIKVHGERYDYSKVEYVNAHAKICIICREHGEFYQCADSHLRGRGCPICGNNGNKPKEKGYWDVYENCVDEVKKHRNKHTLQKECYGCYQGLLRNGWYDEVSEKYFSNEILYMDYNSPINTVYAYIIEDLNAVYVGRTNNLERRHRQHVNGIKHSDGRIEYDTIAMFCKENNIEIPLPIILEDCLVAEESQVKEDVWRKEFLSKGYNVLNKAATGRGIGSLGATIKWNYESCKFVANECRNRYEMKKTNQSAYQSALRNGWLDEFFPNKKLENGYWNILENVQEEAKKYKNLKEFSIKGGGAYNAARKNGFLKELIEWKKL